MGAPKNALAFPPKLEDYDPPSKITTACLLVVAVSGWVVTWCAQIIFSCTVGLTMSKKRKQYWNGYLFRLLSAAPVARLTPGIKVEKTKDSYEFTPDQINGKSAVMVVCNHRSDFDPFALAAAILPLETKYVAKSDLFKVPFGGWAMQRAGDLAVRFDPKRSGGWGTVKGSTGQLLADAAAHFQAGNSIAIFPEGNRLGAYVDKTIEAGKHPTKLMPFKPPFFDCARKNGVPVVCVSMAGTDAVWPVKTLSMRPGKVTVHIHQPIDGAEFADDQAFCDHCRDVVGMGYLDLIDSLGKTN